MLQRCLLRWRSVRVAHASLRLVAVSHVVSLHRSAGELLVLLTALEYGSGAGRRSGLLWVARVLEDASLRVARVHRRRATVHSCDCHVVELLTLIPASAVGPRDLASHLAHAGHGEHLLLLLHLDPCPHLNV